MRPAALAASRTQPRTTAEERPLILRCQLGPRLWFWILWPLIAAEVQAELGDETVRPIALGIATSLSAAKKAARSHLSPRAKIAGIVDTKAGASVWRDDTLRWQWGVAYRQARARAPFVALGLIPQTPLDSAAAVQREFRRFAKMLHPDHGGDANQFRALRAACEQALRAVPRAVGRCPEASR